jgi:NAD(P)-dependent dehydrogenase (short-subunit alcohol dehydrogenase family)
MAECAVRRISYLAGYAVDVFNASMSIDGKSSPSPQEAAGSAARRQCFWPSVAPSCATEVLRQEAGPNLRVTEISPGMIATNFGDTITDLPTKKMIEERLGPIAISPEAIARGIAFAIEQPPEGDVGSIVIRPKAQE